MLVQLETCKTCKNRKMDPNVGLVCGLTNEKPTFINVCNDYNEDIKMTTYYNNNQVIDASDKDFLSTLTEQQKFELVGKSNFPLAVLTAISMSIICSVFHVVMIEVFNLSIGLLFIGYGLLVGLSVRFVGKGIERKFGIATAISFGIIMLILFVILVAISQMSIGGLFTFVWYVFGVIAAYKMSFRKINRAELQKINNKYNSFNN